MNNAVQAAVACNALGILVCDWSLPGQVNPATVSIPALLAGAGLAWKAETDLVSEFAVRRREQNTRKPTYLAYWQALVGSGKFCARNLGTTGVCLSLHFMRKVIQHGVGITMPSKINRKNRPTDIALQPCLSFKFMFASLQMTLRSSLPDVLSQHVFMDTSGTFGRALMDLGRTHSTILKDETDEFMWCFQLAWAKESFYDKNYWLARKALQKLFSNISETIATQKNSSLNSFNLFQYAKKLTLDGTNCLENQLSDSLW